MTINAHALPILGDSALLTILIRNLIDNAVRYSPSGSIITVTLAANYLSITNPSRKMMNEKLKRLGERFYRPAGQDSVGSGLGLSIVESIAKLHGLDMQITNTDNMQNKSIEFQVKLSHAQQR